MPHIKSYNSIESLINDKADRAKSDQGYLSKFYSIFEGRTYVSYHLEGNQFLWDKVYLNFFETVINAVTFGMYCKNIISKFELVEILSKEKKDQSNLDEKVFLLFKKRFNTSIKLNKSSENSPSNSDEIENSSANSSLSVQFSTKNIKETITIFKKIDDDKNEIHLVPVIDQREFSRGGVHCGFHAFKNTLIFMGIDLENDITESDFNDSEIYLKFKQFLDDYNPENDGDISISSLSSALTDLANQEKIVSAELKPFQRMLLDKINTISILNADGEGIMTGGGAGEADLATAANLWKFTKESYPKSHGFIMGFEGHWISVYLDYDETGKKSWYCADSYPTEDKENARRVKKAIAYIDELLDDPDIFFQLKYIELFAETLDKISNKIDKNGSLIDSDDEENLIKASNILNGQIPLIYRALETTGLLQLEEKENSINDPASKLKKIFSFFIKKIPKQIIENPQLREILNHFSIPMPDSLDVKDRSMGDTTSQLPFVLDNELIQSFRNGVDEDKSATVKEAKIHYYNCRDSEDPSKYFKDSGFGCAWRSISTLLSSLNRSSASTSQIFDELRNPDRIVELYRLLNPKRQLTEQDIENLRNCAPFGMGNPRGWGEPFLGQLYLKSIGIDSDLRVFRNFPTNMIAPRMAFEAAPIQETLFSNLVNDIFSHFRTQKVPIMIDDGTYAYTILGIKKIDEEIFLLIGDPHTENPLESVYTVRLDKEGKHLGSSLDYKLYYPSSIKRIEFFRHNWMMLFPR